MDKIDRSILALLQSDAETPIEEIARRVKLSTTPCWRRIQRLKESGAIRRTVALCDPARLGVGTTVFVNVRTNQHHPGWLARFAAAVRDIPEVIEFYRMSGETDYLLKIVVPDISGYDKVYKKLIAAVELYDVTSSFAMEEIKYSTALPTEYAG